MIVVKMIIVKMIIVKVKNLKSENCKIVKEAKIAKNIKIKNEN